MDSGLLVSARCPPVPRSGLSGGRGRTGATRRRPLRHASRSSGAGEAEGERPRPRSAAGRNPVEARLRRPARPPRGTSRARSRRYFPKARKARGTSSRSAAPSRARTRTAASPRRSSCERPSVSKRPVHPTPPSNCCSARPRRRWQPSKELRAIRPGSRLRRGPTCPAGPSATSTGATPSRASSS